MSDISSLSFEAALAELEKIVGQLESGQSDLENSIACYERGVQLKAHCETKLKEAEAKIEKISLDQSGNIKIEPVDTP